jgi:hypothetical protein
MELNQLPFNIQSSQDVGIGLLHNVASLPDPLASSLEILLDALPAGAHVSVPDPEDNDCTYDIRRGFAGLLFRHGGKIAEKAWISVSRSQAVQWLEAGASKSEGARSGVWIFVPRSER